MRQRYERLSTTFDGSQLNAVKVQMLQGYSSEWVAHSGDEFVYVLAGQVRYTLRKKDYLLSAGDSLHFDAHERHRVVNVGAGPAEMIVVGTLPFFDDDQSEFAPGDGERSTPHVNAAKKKAATPRAAIAKVAQGKQHAVKAKPQAKAKASAPKPTTSAAKKKR